MDKIHRTKKLLLSFSGKRGLVKIRKTPIIKSAIIFVVSIRSFCIKNLY